MPEPPDGPTEDSTERDGLLSYAGEYHALTLGLVVGLTASLTGETAFLLAIVPFVLGLKKTRGKAMREIGAEPWYAAGGVVIGYGLPFLHFLYVTHPYVVPV